MSGTAEGEDEEGTHMDQYVYGSQVDLNHLERRDQVVLAVSSLLYVL